MNNSKIRLSRLKINYQGDRLGDLDDNFYVSGLLSQSPTHKGSLLDEDDVALFGDLQAGIKVVDKELAVCGALAGSLVNDDFG